MNKRDIGSRKEDEAARFLLLQGLIIKEHGFSCRFGEIDLIAADGEFTVFVEVKYRKTASSGHPEEAVDYRKARKISKVADYYRVKSHMKEDACIRFDVIAIEGDEITWHKNAFEYTT